MNRRDMVASLLVLGAVPVLGLAKPTRRYRIAMLWMASETAIKPYEQAFLEGLRDRGYVIGKNIDIEIRYAAGDRARMPVLVDELLAMKPDVLTGVSESAQVMKRKTSMVPIVFLASADPIGEGLVQSLAHPGANATGLSFLLEPVLEKQVEFLAELLPKMSSLAYLGDPMAPFREKYEAVVRKAAKTKALTLVFVEAHHAKSLEQAFAELGKQKPGGLVIAPSPVLFNLQRQITERALRLHLPAISANPGFAESGGAMSYGVNFIEGYHYAAKYVDRILKGAKPADLPVEQFAKYELVLNTKTAHTLGIAIPHSILVRADRVIQ